MTNECVGHIMHTCVTNMCVRTCSVSICAETRGHSSESGNAYGAHSGVKTLRAAAHKDECEVKTKPPSTKFTSRGPYEILASSDVWCVQHDEERRVADTRRPRDR